MKEVTIKHEGRANGNYSIYVKEGQGFWSYTGLTFTSRQDCDKMVAVIRSLWAKP